MKTNQPAPGERRAKIHFHNVYREEYAAILAGDQPFVVYYNHEAAPDPGDVVTVREQDDGSGEKTGRELVADVTATREATSAIVVGLARRPGGVAGFREADYRAEVLRNCPGFDADAVEKKLTLGSLGLAGEGAEVLEAVLAAAQVAAKGGAVADLAKKALFHGAPLAELREKIKKEMGDSYWYLEYLGAAFSWTREEILGANVAKLRARHPNGWTPESQRAKADERGARS